MQRFNSKHYAISDDDYMVVKEMSKRLNCAHNLVFKILHDLIVRVCGANTLSNLLEVKFKRSLLKDRSRYMDFSFLKDDSIDFRRKYYNLARLLNNDEFEKAYNSYMLEYDNNKLEEYFYKKL